MTITWSSSSSLVCRKVASCEALVGDLVSDWRCHSLRSRWASLTAAFNLSSERTVKRMELWGLPTFSFGIGSSRSIITGWVRLGFDCRCLSSTSLSRVAQELSGFVALTFPTFSITMGPGKRTLVVRFLGFAGMASLNNSCGKQNAKLLSDKTTESFYNLHPFTAFNHLLELKAID